LKGVGVVKIEGIMPPVLTPFKEDEELDEKALKKELKYFLQVGVHGLTVCGSTGEGYALTSEEVGRVTKIAVGEAKGKVPVITGVITDSTKTALMHAKKAKEAGADALMVTPVHYVFLPTSEGLYDYFKRIGEETRLPIIIYNVIPWVTVSADLAKKLTEIKYIKGIKQSGGDIHGLADMVRTVGDKIPIMTAIDDMLLPSFVIGAKGAIAAICTVAPKQCIQLYESVKKGDLKNAASIHHKLLPVWRAVGKGDMPARAKEAFAQMGMPVGPARSPLIPVNEAAKKEIHAALVEAGLLKK